MAMSTQLLAAAALAGINVVLLIALGTVWVRNYRTFRTNLVLGLVAFAAVMLVENVVAVYFYFSAHMLYVADPGIQTIVLALRALQLVALLFLTYVTMR